MVLSGECIVFFVWLGQLGQERVTGGEVAYEKCSQVNKHYMDVNFMDFDKGESSIIAAVG